MKIFLCLIGLVTCVCSVSAQAVFSYYRIAGIKSFFYTGPNKEVEVEDREDFAGNAVSSISRHAGVGGVIDASLNTALSPVLRLRAQAPQAAVGAYGGNHRGIAQVNAGLEFWQTAEYPMITGPFGSADIPAILKLTVKGRMAPGIRVVAPWNPLQVIATGSSTFSTSLDSGQSRILYPGATAPEMRIDVVRYATNYVSPNDRRLRFTTRVSWSGEASASIDLQAKLEVILPEGFRVAAPFESFNAPPEPKASIVVDPPVVGETNRIIIITQPARCQERYVLEEADLNASVVKFWPKTPVLSSQCDRIPVTIRTEPSSLHGSEAKAFRLRKLEPGSDEASAPEYWTGWDTGTNAGSGFLPWILASSNAVPADSFVIQDSATNGLAPSGSINSAGLRAWGIRTASGTSALASRPLQWPLVIGQTLGWNLDTGTVLPDGRVGVALRTEGTNRWEFSAAAGSSTYRVHDGSSTNATTGWPLTDGGLRCEFTALATNSYVLKVVGPTWTNSVSGVLAGEGLIDEIQFFSHGGGSTEAATLFFNHLRIDP